MNVQNIKADASPDVMSAVMIHTADPVEKIIARGGSGDWFADRRRMRRQRYAVICQLGGADRNAAVMIGKIAGVVQSEGQAGEQNRSVILFSEYALCHIPDLWPAKYQNSIFYTSLEDQGISLEDLEWHKIDQQPKPSEVLPSMDEIKVMIGKHFGVPATSVDINIRL